jgi:hypothetical protein
VVTRATVKPREELDVPSAPARSRARTTACAGALLLGALLAPAAGAAVPAPEVIGPVAATAPPGDPSHGYPFFASDDGLAGDGYVEQEFFLDGAATAYDANGSATATVRSTDHDYRTRVVVRRPVAARDFNGTVVLEWFNVSNQYDQEVDWLQTHEHLVREGYAWVGVSAQRAGVHSATGLRAWSPGRYGDLDVTDGGAVTDDALSYDIFSQAAAAVRAGGVLGALQADQVLATGHSQSAGRLRTYVNSVHPLAGVIDGFMLHGLVGNGTIRTDVGVPVFKLQSESDVLLLGQAATRQADTPLLRTWEVAGTSHGDLKLIAEHGPLRVRDIGSPPDEFPIGTPTTCANPPLSRIPFFMAQARGYDWLRTWAGGGAAPPSAPFIELESVTPAVARRDEHGNALGGLRLPQHEVPTALNSGLNSGPGFCFLHGTYRPFDAATLDALYGNHGGYVRRAGGAIRATLAAGYITPEDARQSQVDAARTRVK